MLAHADRLRAARQSSSAARPGACALSSAAARASRAQSGADLAGDLASGPARFGHDFSRFSITNTRHAATGDRPGAADHEALSGDPRSAQGAPQVPAQTGPTAISGDATSISTADLSAAEWNNNAHFKWWIKWVTDGASGWIVQKIDSTYAGTKADGSAITNASVGLTPSYYEAWEVDASGGITGSLGATGNRDRWQRPDLGALGSTTSLSVVGTVYWTARDPALSGFTSGGVANAGSLLSSTTAPAGIGSALLTRSAFGAWASTGDPMLPGCFTS